MNPWHVNQREFNFEKQNFIFGLQPAETGGAGKRDPERSPTAPERSPRSLWAIFPTPCSE